MRRGITRQYRASTTRITVGNHESPSIVIVRGVKQWDPLSPILLNMVMDELVCGLDRGSYREIPLTGDREMRVMAYADDIILIAESIESAKKLLKAPTSFFYTRGLAVNPAKCVALST